MANFLHIGLGLIAGGLILSTNKVADAFANIRIAQSAKNITTMNTQDSELLLRNARSRGYELTLDELTLARLGASEHGSGTIQEIAVFMDAELNRAERKGLGVTEHLTGGTGVYGRQGRHNGVRRPAATRQHANLRHLEIAKAVLSPNSGIRGIALGAERFFDPRAQNITNKNYIAGRGKIIASCKARGTLKAWSFDLPKCGKQRCCADSMPPNKAHGPNPEQWVGEIYGVDPTRVMAMKPSKYGPEHSEMYRKADAILAKLEEDMR